MRDHFKMKPTIWSSNISFKIILPFRSRAFVAKSYVLHFNRNAKTNYFYRWFLYIIVSLWSTRVILSVSTGWLCCWILSVSVTSSTIWQYQSDKNVSYECLYIDYHFNLNKNYNHFLIVLWYILFYAKCPIFTVHIMFLYFWFPDIIYTIQRNLCYQQLMLQNSAICKYLSNLQRPYYLFTKCYYTRGNKFADGYLF